MLRDIGTYCVSSIKCTALGRYSKKSTPLAQTLFEAIGVTPYDENAALAGKPDNDDCAAYSRRHG